MDDAHAKDTRRRLAEGLTAWLTFEFQCNRGYLFSERYMAHAVGQILRGRVEGDVFAEVKHPALKLKKKGHPAAVDFAVKNQQAYALAVETKWIGQSTFHPKLLIWDGFRLESFARTQGARAFLILAGLKKELEKFVALDDFQLQRPRGSAGSFPLLPLPASSKTHVVKLGKCPPVVAAYVKKRADRYEAGAIAESFRCSTPLHEVRDKNLGFAVYVWEISSPE